MLLSHALSMGGYAMYVWPAYCITLAVFGFNLITTLREKTRTQQRIQQFHADDFSKSP